MKKVVLVLVCSVFFLGKSFGQIAEVKVNVMAGAVAIFNPSIEIGFGKHSGVSMDFVGAFAEENYMGTGYPFLASMGIMGYRFYTKKDSHRGFFVGADLGFNTFKMNKNIIPLVAHDHSKNTYDFGYGILMGMTLGYKFLFKERWGVEISVSGGWQHSQHEVYQKGDNNKYYKAVDMNASAEWFPYKAGVYLTYRFGNPKK